MKNNLITRKKLKYGGLSAALTAGIIAIVVLVNVIFSALARKFLWTVDLTPDLRYTLSDTAIDLLRYGEDKFEESFSPIEMIDKTGRRTGNTTRRTTFPKATTAIRTRK